MMMMDIEELIGPEDAMAIGYKVAEMAERLKVADKIVPGSQAAWAFEVDDLRFSVTVKVAAAIDHAEAS